MLEGLSITMISTYATEYARAVIGTYLHQYRLDTTVRQAASHRLFKSNQKTHASLQLLIAAVHIDWQLGASYESINDVAAC